MFSTRRLFDLVMYTTASCLFPRCVRLLLHAELQMLVSPYDTMSKMILKSSLHNSISSFTFMFTATLMVTQSLDMLKYKLKTPENCLGL
ncbi:hypothetical protein ACN38_g7709 [Penicillium nordicum]|uniref:Uncharacterized protein n=1 Tax=Penicillium nordicum TaxID=229535 RepID=A0A0N0RYI2_9EURO|nr:hypothetical protein ACN38_g7709 [Penicillium nordicum]